MIKAGSQALILVLQALWLASCGQSGTTQSQGPPPSYFRIVDSVTTGSIYAYAPSIIVKNGTYHLFYCSQSGLPPTWDAIRYTSSTDGQTWSAPQIMVVPSWDNGMDIAACDPSLVYYQGFYYLYYSSAMITAPPNIVQTIVRVARSGNIGGPYLTYTQRDTWESTPPDPHTIISPLQIHTTDPPGYGAGQTSVVARNGELLMWYTDDSLFVDGQPNLQTFMLESTDAVTWTASPTHATNETGGSASLINQGSVDVKYDPSTAQFVMYGIENQFASTADLARAVSNDGINWSAPQTVIPPSQFPRYTHDVGVASDETGNIVATHTLVAFGAPYDLADVNNWGQWDLYGVYVNPP